MAAKNTSSNNVNSESLAKWCKALAHPVRIRIFQHLKEVDQCICGEIVNNFSLSQSTISQHLKHLKDAGLIIGEIEVPRTCYCLNPEIVKQFKESVAKL